MMYGFDQIRDPYDTCWVFLRTIVFKIHKNSFMSTSKHVIT